MRPAVRFGLAVLAGVLLAQAAWIMAVPPFRGMDEIDHVFRAAGVATGQWRLTEPAQNGRGFLVEVPAELATAASAQCEALSYPGEDNCRPVARSTDGTATIATAAGNYNPVFYWVVGMAGRPFEGTASLYAMRLATALLCAVGIAVAAAVLHGDRTRRWLPIGLFAALTPTLLYTTAVTAPNGPEIVAGLCLWAGLLGLGRAGPSPRRRRLLFVLVAVSAAALVLLRTLGPLWVLLVLLVAVLFLGGRTVVAVVRQSPVASLVSAAVVGIATAGAVWWSLDSGSYAPPVRDAVSGLPSATPDSVPADAVAVHLWVLQAVGAFPFRDQPAPAFVYPLVLLVLVTGVVVALRRGSPGQRVAIAAGCLLALGVPVVLSLLTMEGRGVIWQGRYALPFMVGLLPVCGLVLDRWGWAPTEWVRLVPLGLAMLAVGHVASVSHVILQELARGVSRRDDTWVHPGPTAVGLVMLAAWLAFASTYLGRRHA